MMTRSFPGALNPALSPSRSWQIRPTWLLFMFLLTATLCGVGWMGEMAGSREVFLSAAVVGLVLPLGYGALRALSFAARKLGSQDVFSPWICFPLAYVFWFILGALDFVDDPWHVMYGMFDPMPPGIWGYAALGLTGYLGGVLLARRRSGANPKTEKDKNNHREKDNRSFPALRISKPLENRWRPSLQRSALAALFLLMLASYGALVFRMGVPVLSAGAAEDRLAVNNFGPTQTVFLCTAWTLMLLLPASFWMERLGKKRTVGGVFVVSALLLSMGGRGNFFAGCLTLLIACNYLRRRIRLRSLIVATIGLFAGLSAYGFLRDSSFRDADSFTYLEQIGIPPAAQPFVYSFTYVRGTVATFRDVSDMIPSEIPYQYGRLTLLPLSTLLPGHHEMADMYFKNILGHDFVGLGQPATPLGPLYGDLGGFGIVAGMFAFGALASSLYRRMRQRPTTVSVLVYAWVMQTGLLGLFASLFPYITALFIPLLWLALDRFLSSQPPKMVSRLVVPLGVAPCPPTF